MPHWWVTIRPDPTRTEDLRIPARSPWAAAWLARQLRPGVEVLVVRAVHRGAGSDLQHTDSTERRDG